MLYTNNTSRHFWFQGSNAQKVKFMVLERGPQAFIEGTIQLIHDCIAEGSSIKNICLSASAHISERIAILTNLRCSLATFLAEVCFTLFMYHLIWICSLNPFRKTADFYLLFSFKHVYIGIWFMSMAVCIGLHGNWQVRWGVTKRSKEFIALLIN